MQDPLESYQQALTCPFCQTKFSNVVKLIPDCGNFICGACYTELDNSLDKSSKRYKCEACGDYHVMPENGMLVCKKIASFLRHPIEKPLSDDAKKLKQLIENVQEELTRLQAFDPRDHIEHTCVQLEHEVSQAAESAVKHIKQIETDLQYRIRAYRQRCLVQLEVSSAGSSTANATAINQMASTETGTLAQEIGEFSAKWSDYFKRLNSLASDSQVEAAIYQTTVFQIRMKALDQEIRIRTLCGTLMQFRPCESFLSVRNQLGELVEISSMFRSSQNEKIRIQATPSLIITGHSGWIEQAVFLPDNRLASCSSDETIKVWDTVSGKELFPLKPHTGSVNSIAILPNGWLASGSSDKKIKLWDLEKRKEVKTLRGHKSSIASLKVLKNGNLVSYSNDDTIKTWNPYSSENNLLLTIKGHGNQFWIMPLGILPNDFLASFTFDEDSTVESTLRIWNPKDGQLVKSLPTGLKAVWPVLALSNDQIAFGTEDGTIKIIDLEDESKNRTKEKAHEKYVCCLLKLSNGNLASSGQDREFSVLINSIKVWNFFDMTLLQLVKTAYSDLIHSLGVSEDGKLLASGSRDKTIRLWPTNIIKEDETNSLFS